MLLLPRRAGIYRLNPAQQKQNNENNENQAQAAAWVISPATAVIPPGKRAGDEQDDNDDQNDSKHTIHLDCAIQKTLGLDTFSSG